LFSRNYLSYTTLLNRLGLVSVILVATIALISCSETTSSEQRFEMAIIISGYESIDQSGDHWDGLHLVAANDGSLKRIGAGVSFNNLSVSPDGKQLVYTTYDSAKHSSIINLIDIQAAVEADRFKPFVVLPSGQIGIIHAPIWSPDGSQLLFWTRATSTQESDVYTVLPDGRNLSKLTDSSAGDYSPRWSPDGKQIVFTSNRNGSGGIFTMNSDGSEQIRISDLKGGSVMLPSWSPDGNEIAYLVNPPIGNEVEMTIIDTNGKHRKFKTDAIFGSYDWSPDSSEIVFAGWSSNSDRTRLYVVDRSGVNVSLLVDSEEDTVIANPKWSPDGSRILFDSPLGIRVVNSDGTNESGVLENSTSENGLRASGIWLNVDPDPDAQVKRIETPTPAPTPVPTASPSPRPTSTVAPTATALPTATVVVINVTEAPSKSTVDQLIETQGGLLSGVVDILIGSKLSAPIIVVESGTKVVWKNMTGAKIIVAASDVDEEWTFSPPYQQNKFLTYHPHIYKEEGCFAYTSAKFGIELDGWVCVQN
jgi:Tol biopolymer transport system component